MYQKDDIMILQIMPAENWLAVFEVGDDALDAEEVTKPVTCFALVEFAEDGGDQRDILPMYWNGKSMEFCRDNSCFIRLLSREECAAEEAAKKRGVGVRRSPVV